MHGGAVTILLSNYTFFWHCNAISGHNTQPVARRWRANVHNGYKSSKNHIAFHPDYRPINVHGGHNSPAIPSKYFSWENMHLLIVDSRYAICIVFDSGSMSTHILPVNLICADHYTTNYKPINIYTIVHGRQMLSMHRVITRVNKKGVCQHTCYQLSFYVRFNINYIILKVGFRHPSKNISVEVVCL